jgi:hypothetical protein
MRNIYASFSPPHLTTLALLLAVAFLRIALPCRMQHDAANNTYQD